VIEPGPAAARSVRLVHSGDCHLGSDTRDDRSSRHAFEALIDATRAADAAALVIAGDLFDHNRVADETISWALGELGRLDCAVILLPGNHDSAVLAGLAARDDAAERWPRLAIITAPDGQVVHVPAAGLHVWGRALLDHVPQFRPLQGIPPRPADGWSVALGHGLVVKDGNPQRRASPIWPTDIEIVNWDYVALGHVHVYRVVREPPAAPVVYCGATASSRDGRPGAVLVEFSGTDGVRFRWQPIG
jgi:DNA repair protein SbcD/Mre11